MKLFTLYIGSSKDPIKFRRSKIRKILSRLHTDFIFHSVKRYDDGKREMFGQLSDTVIINISTSCLDKAIETLKKELNQKSIGVRETQPILFL